MSPRWSRSAAASSAAVTARRRPRKRRGTRPARRALALAVAGLAAVAASVAPVAAAPVAAAPVAVSPAAAASPPSGAAPFAATVGAAVAPTLAELLSRARGALVKAAAERVAKARRPVPLEVRWAPRRVATLEVGGALGALLGADVDGDGAAELYAVTDQALLAYSLAGGKVRELSRLPFAGDEAPLRSRDPVSTVAVDLEAGEIMAGSSSYAHSVRARWRGGALVAVEMLEGLPLCGHRRAQLVPGRNYFAERTAALAAVDSATAAAVRSAEPGLYGERCRQGLLLADGSAATASARLPVEGPLEVIVEPACAQACPRSRHELPAVGVAFDLGDVDRDGRVDVAYSGAGAPGDPDAVRVVPVADPRRTLYRRAFTGGVAALTLVDLDGDGASEVVVAVRLPGAPRVDLWRLN